MALLVLTVGQLAVATFVPGLDQFEGKGFAARLILYPVMMLLVPIWWLRRRRRAVRSMRDDRTGDQPAQDSPAPPWAAFAWIMLPFLVDVTGNTLNLYAALWWWDDVNHLVNWLFLSLGVGLLLSRSTPARRPLDLLLLVAGIGAIMAIGWEVGEYYAFIRGGTELGTAYTDTLGDEVLGTLGATLGGSIIARRASS